MRYWWVNQKQTFNQESDGGFLWSPKRRADGQRNPFYESMREVAPGDLIFSFADTFIPAIGVAQSTAYENPKPAEFGGVGPNWSAIGWKVSVRYFRLRNSIRPAEFISQLWPLMPEKYAPLQHTGRGNQGVYLTELPAMLAEALINLIGEEARAIARANMTADDPRSVAEPLQDVIVWEDYLAEQIRNNDSVPEAERRAIVMARRGQGLFKNNVQRIEQRCRVTGVERIEHLIASHCKPWRDCADNQERLDGENGLLLTPSIDHLFDRGYISFEGDGQLLVSPVAHRPSLVRMGIPENKLNVGQFSSGQRRYLEYHREQVFLERSR